MPHADPTVSADVIADAAAILKRAKHPVIFMGRVSRDLDAWNARVALAEALDAKVISDLKIACGFPTDHPLHAGAPASNALVPEAIAAIKAADVILSLDWVDLGGALRNALGSEAPKAKIICISADFHVHNGWSMDYEMLPPVDLMLPTAPDAAVPQLLAALGGGKSRKPAAVPAKAEAYEPSNAPIRVDDLARALRAAVGERDVTLTHLPLSWNGATWPFRHPLDYIGSEGGGGVGGGPGISVGAALALKGSGRLPIAICGDGDFCMGVTALWTAVHYRIPLLVVVCNNRSFFNDELHQERVARMRNRPPENRWIGQRISDPDIDCAALGAAQGAVGFPPVMKTGDLMPIFAKAIAAVEAGQVAVVDVRVEPGYSAVATAAMLRGTEKP
jgi:thiamine pyrophosphate-dependent acetolactate synthase large subunit-like protein